MTKKKYPIISIVVAVVWAVFFYPADRARSKPVAVKAAPAAPAVADVRLVDKNLHQVSAPRAVVISEK